MEYSVCRRENIQNRAKTSSAPTKGNFIKKIQDLKRNIRQLKGGISQADEAIQIMRAEQSKLSDGLQEIQLEISQGESGFRGTASVQKRGPQFPGCGTKRRVRAK